MYHPMYPNIQNVTVPFTNWHLRRLFCLLIVKSSNVGVSNRIWPPAFDPNITPSKYSLKCFAGSAPPKPQYVSQLDAPVISLSFDISHKVQFWFTQSRQTALIATSRRARDVWKSKYCDSRSSAGSAAPSGTYYSWPFL
jgi:hypothetical protein